MGIWNSIYSLAESFSEAWVGWAHENTVLAVALSLLIVAVAALAAADPTNKKNRHDLGIRAVFVLANTAALLLVSPETHIRALTWIGAVATATAVTALVVVLGVLVYLHSVTLPDRRAAYQRRRTRTHVRVS